MVQIAIVSVCEVKWWTYVQTNCQYYSVFFGQSIERTLQETSPQEKSSLMDERKFTRRKISTLSLSCLHRASCFSLQLDEFFGLQGLSLRFSITDHPSHICRLDTLIHEHRLKHWNVRFDISSKQYVNNRIKRQLYILIWY